MTQPVQEPSPDRAVSALDYRTRQLARRPGRVTRNNTHPWIAIGNGATTAPTDVWMPVPSTDSAYDPLLVTLGDIFDLDTTDTGDVGNTRFRIKTLHKGVFYAELWTEWSEPTTDGANDHGFAVQDMFYPSTPGSILFGGNEFSRASADWPKNITTGDFEMLSNPFLFSSFTLFLDAGWTWDPYAMQTTGVDRGLNGVRLYVVAMEYSDPASWTYGSV